ncbi:MAG: hypothetical protein PPP58_07295 [Natronomonas sp.]
MSTDTRRLGLGIVALIISSVVILAAAFIDTPIPPAVSALAALGLAAGSLLVGLSEKGAGV